MRKLSENPRTSTKPAPALEDGLPLPTPQYRRKAWLEFQRAIDPLARPKPPGLPRHQH